MKKPTLTGFAVLLLVAAFVGCTTEAPGPVPPVKNIEQQKWSSHVASAGAR